VNESLTRRVQWVTRRWKTFFAKNCSRLREGPSGKDLRSRKDTDLSGWTGEGSMVSWGLWRKKPEELHCWRGSENVGERSWYPNRLERGYHFQGCGVPGRRQRRKLEKTGGACRREGERAGFAKGRGMEGVIGECAISTSGREKKGNCKPSYTHCEKSENRSQFTGNT